VSRVPDPSVQPPEGLRKIAAAALAKFWNESIANIGEPVEALYDSDEAQDSADAVLAALFDACEVREEWLVTGTVSERVNAVGFRPVPRTVHLPSLLRARNVAGWLGDSKIQHRLAITWSDPEPVSECLSAKDSEDRADDR
jgi:hypothetical protein